MDLPEGQTGSDRRAEGEIVSISGSRARILLADPHGQRAAADGAGVAIGALLAVDTGKTITICLVTSMNVDAATARQDYAAPRYAEVELVGELIREPDGYLRTFRRGVSVYPRLGDVVAVASSAELRKAYQFGSVETVRIGSIHQDRTIPAVIKVDDMLSKHFAILGSTGTGKSCSVALLLRQVLAKHPNAHVMLLDPHNEYATCFAGQAQLMSPENLCLPFWLLNFEEIVEILIGDPRKNAAEVILLRDFIPLAKRQYAAGRLASSAIVKPGAVKRKRFTVDAPTPYRISDLIEQLNEHMGRLENQKDLGPVKKLKARIESIVHDPRYGFMFGHMAVQDNLAEIIRVLFRIPVAGQPITVVQLMGLPSEIVNVIVSVLSRLAFDVAQWSNGRIPITFVCEEAHRYVPSDSSLGFEPTKRSIARIAKEGRKYGASLCIVSQRPGDLDQTILSQCSTLFTMRLSNERDQAIVKSALSDASASLLEFLPALGMRETLVFGEGVSLPSRIILDDLDPADLPKGNSARFGKMWAEEIADNTLIDGMVTNWRAAGQQYDEDIVPEAQIHGDDRAGADKGSAQQCANERDSEREMHYAARPRGPVAISAASGNGGKRRFAFPRPGRGKA